MGMTMFEESGMFFPADWGLAIGDMLTLMGMGAGQGGQGGSNTSGGKGGNSGFLVFKTYKLLTLDPIPVSIGLGGDGTNPSGTTTAAQVGNSGGDTSFGSILIAKGATNLEGSFFGGLQTVSVGGGAAGGYIPGLKKWGGNGINGDYITSIPSIGTVPLTNDAFQILTRFIDLSGTAGYGGVYPAGVGLAPRPKLNTSGYNALPGNDGFYNGGKAGLRSDRTRHDYCGAGGSGYGAGGGGANNNGYGGKGANGWLGIYW